jgi:hypothetical protein
MAIMTLLLLLMVLYDVDGRLLCRKCQTGLYRRQRTQKSRECDMKPFMQSIRMLIILGALATLFPVPFASAVLGGLPGSVEVDHSPLAGTIRVIPASGYTIQELTSPDLVVREYVSSVSGKVFAVSWTGRRSPDLPALLAAYFVEYETALAGREGRPSRPRGVTRVETSRLVVEAGGHMGSIWGKAYLPSQLPPGVKPEAIQ